MTEDIQVKYCVLKLADIHRYLDEHQIKLLATLVNKVEECRAAEGKKPNMYLVCNQDETYAEKVQRIILEGERAKFDAAHGIEKVTCHHCTQE